MSKNNDIPLGVDPDATISGPLSAPLPRPEPDITVILKGLPQGDSDPEITIVPVPRKDDPDATFNGPLSDLNPDANVSSPSGPRRRSNPFAPKALPEALKANLAALGGLNPLIAFANPILSAVPQIGAARNHPDPALLKETLQDLIEAFEAGASKAGVSEEILEGAVYALCCLADDSAASTLWGQDWTTNGLLHELRGEKNGGEGFFALLQATKKNPVENANLLEFFYTCLALGFQGRYRKADGAASQNDAELTRIRSDLHALVTSRRARPAGGLSERWRGVTPGFVPSTPSSSAANSANDVPWRGVGIAAVAVFVIFTGYKLFDQPAPPAPMVASAPVVVPAPVVAPKVAPAPAAVPAATSAPAVVPAATPTPPVTPEPSSTVGVATVVLPATSTLTAQEAMEKELSQEMRRGLVSIANLGGRTSITIKDDRQFGSGTIEPAPGVRAVVERIAEALGRTTGPILVRGYADNVPVKPGAFASNLELSAARAEAVAALIAAKLGQQQRVTSEGVGEADPIAPNDTEINRAKNRRIAIVLGPQP